VRFVGDPETRIREDVLRILRFFRFHAHFGTGAPDAAGVAACAKLAPLLPTLSAERIAAELRRLLAAPDPATTLELMRETGVLAILPEITNVTRLRGLQALTAVEARDPVLRLAALLPDDPEAAAAVGERLRLSNEERARLLALAAPPLALWPARTPRDLRRALYRLGAPTIRDLALLAQASGDAALGQAAYDAAKSWSPMALPVRGQDALTLGMSPGPRVGQLIAALEAWWEEQDYQPDRTACLAKLKELASAG
jgi:poly(A) polymerase